MTSNSTNDVEPSRIITNLEGKLGKGIRDEILRMLKGGKKVHINKLGYFYSQNWSGKKIIGFSPYPCALSNLNNGKNVYINNQKRY
ncbi:MAG: hypothetical protein JSW73_00945 [Candidatus Woesearchaeota archaeon]|nr:MAG: hypothetical protein JSW73_00945 [Candidatus Woesearchaeota archaeon]